MTWLNPWAWLGLIAIGAPVFAHLLARRTSVRLPFPTLRFIQPSRLSPARRRRLTDLGMLALRIAVVIAAVAALAGPLVLTTNRRGADTTVAVIVVDTSPSMERARDEARAAATDAAGRIDIARTIESNMPATAIAEAAQWLGRHGGRREIVVVSDFQRGTLTAGDVAGIPAGIGLRFVAVRRSATTELDLPEWSRGDLQTRTRLAVNEGSSTADWRTERLVSSAPRPTFKLFATDADRAAAEATLTAAIAVTPVDRAATRAIAVVFPGAAERDAMLAAASPADERWMIDALTAVPDALLAPPVRIAKVAVDGANYLTIFAGTAPGTVASASLLSHLIATAQLANAPEFDPGTIPAADLERWQRPATPAQAPVMDREGPSDARWLWVLVLALLAVEFVARRWIDRARAEDAVEAAHARVA